MAHKYGLLINNDAVAQSGNFDVVTLGNTYFWKNGYIGRAVDKKGQTQPIWDSGKTIPMIIVEDANWTGAHDDIINNSAAAWNLANPDNQTGSMQLIFDSTETSKINNQQKSREEALII